MRRFTVICSTLVFSIIGPYLVPPLHADYKQAIADYNQGLYEKAIQELQPDLELNREWEFGHRLLGLCYLNLKNNALAAASLSTAVALKSPVFSTYLGLGQAYFNMKQYGRCIAALNQGEPIAAKEKDPETQKAKLYKLRGSAYYRLNNYNAAVDDLTRALRIGQPDWSDFSMLGISYFNLKQTDEAIEALEKSLSIKPDQPAITELLGKAYLQKGTAALSQKQFTAARELLQKAGNYNPKNGFIYYNIAETYIFEKEYLSAEKNLNQAAALMPENPGVYERLGLVYEKLKKWDSALNAYKKAETIQPSEDIKKAIKRVNQNKSVGSKQ